jgi:arabinofuranosyltransferase
MMITLPDLHHELTSRAAAGLRLGQGLTMARWLRLVPFVLLAMIVARVAWLGTLNEDAFISYRCLENLMHGLGMTWLWDMRSQPYTHPLWMLIHIPLRLVIPDVKVVSFLISFACLGGVLWCLHHRYSGWRPGYSLVVLAPLLLSKCFTEYSTSGLENPLAHLAAALFFVGFLGPQAASFSMDQAAFLAAVAFLNRQDHALFYAIPIALMWIQRRQYLPDLKSLVIAALPVAAWFAFAVFYYGSALPDTYYAKLNAGIDKDLLAVQGLTCLARFIEVDAASFLMIAAGIVSTAFVVKTPAIPYSTRQRFGATAASLMLFLAYSIYAGGDYMLGRFYSTPVIIAVVLLAESLIVLGDAVPVGDAGDSEPATRLSTTARAGLLSIAFIGTGLVSRAAPDFLLGKASTPKMNMWKFGGLDMQAHHWNYRLRSGRVFEGWVNKGALAARASLSVPEGESYVVLSDSAGGNAFYSGPSYGIIDPYGLVDPLLCRLPAYDYSPGHYYRKTPDGYEQSRRAGDSSLTNPSLREYYEKVRFVKSGPLFEPSRIGAAFAYASGADEYLVDEYIVAMALDPVRKSDFWKTRQDRAGWLAALSTDEHRDFRGPLVAWYAGLFSGNPKGKQP